MSPRHALPGKAESSCGSCWDARAVSGVQKEV